MAFSFSLFRFAIKELDVPCLELKLEIWDPELVWTEMIMDSFVFPTCKFLIRKCFVGTCGDELAFLLPLISVQKKTNKETNKQTNKRWASIDANGNFSEAPLAALAYGSTIAERLVSYYLYERLALKTAVLWCMLRRQGPPVNGLQPQIIDYQSHYTKIMPYLSFAFVSKPLSAASLERYRSMVADLRAGNEASYLSQLAEMHAVACALKSFSSWNSMTMFEDLRRLMGGHAFHQYMGVSWKKERERERVF